MTGCYEKPQIAQEGQDSMKVSLYNLRQTNLGFPNIKYYDLMLTSTTVVIMGFWFTLCYRNVGRISTIKYLMQWFHFQRNIIRNTCTLAQKWSVEAQHTFSEMEKKHFLHFYSVSITSKTWVEFPILHFWCFNRHTTILIHATYKHLQFFPYLFWIS